MLQESIGIMIRGVTVEPIFGGDTLRTKASVP